MKSPLTPLLQRGESTTNGSPDVALRAESGFGDESPGLRRPSTSSGQAPSRLLPLIQSGQWQITLPSELEWEKAARGGLAGTIFPWGDSPGINQSNYGYEIGDTSVVGCFPPNGYGLHDMVGNVWEWTRSLSGFEYPYQMGDLQREDLKARNDIYRVVRGGSWYGDQDYSRCAVRCRDRPGARSDFNGFRVVLLCSAPVS